MITKKEASFLFVFFVSFVVFVLDAFCRTLRLPAHG